MNLQQLEYFRIVAELEHITKAANVLHIAQPALSKIIRSLETELSTTVFDRVGKNIVLNENGRILLKYARDIALETELINSELEQYKHEENTSVTLLLKTTPSFVVRIVKDFKHHYPDICVRMLTYNAHVNQIAPPYDFMIDSSICARGEGGKNCHILTTEEMVLATAAKHRLANKVIDLSDLADENFVSLPSNYMQEKEICKVFKIAGVSRHIVLESSDYYTLQKAVEAGFGIAIVPEYSFDFQHNPQISYARIHSPQIENRISILWGNEGPSTKAALCFKNFIEGQSEISLL